VSGEPKAAPTKSTMLLTALVLIVFGFGVSAFNWYLALTDNSYYAVAALVTPFMGFIGVAMLIAPDPVQPGVADSARLRNFRRRSARALLGIGLLAAIANFLLIADWIKL